MSRKEELLFQFFKINLNAYALNTSIKVKLFLIKEPLLCHSIVFVHITAHFIFTRTLPISSVQHNQTSSRPLFLFVFASSLMTKQIPIQIANFQLEQHEGKIKRNCYCLQKFFFLVRAENVSISYSMQTQKSMKRNRVPKTCVTTQPRRLCNRKPFVLRSQHSHHTHCSTLKPKHAMEKRRKTLKRQTYIYNYKIDTLGLFFLSQKDLKR